MSNPIASSDLANTPRLEMSGISKRFGATVALSEVSFSAAPGEVYALIGENGAGKSTLMKILSGAITADAGQIFLDGNVFQPKNPMEARLSGVVMIYQELSLAPHLSVEDNIMLGMEPTRLCLVRRGEVRKTVEKALAQLDHPEIRPGVKVSDLAVAAQQLVEIGRGLALGCRVLVLDEPTSSLTQKDIGKLFQIITELKNQGITILYISHFLEEVKQIADRFTVLRDGAVAGEGETESNSIEQMVHMMVGRQIEELYPRSSRTPGDTILQLNDLAGFNKLEQAGLTLRRGEVLGIAGLVGSGRTDLLRALFGLDRVKRGEIKVGAYLGPASPARRWMQSMGMLSEDRAGEGLAVAMSIADNLTLSKLKALVRPSQQDAVSRHWISELSIKCQGPGQKVADLSGGNQQKVALGRMLHHEVDVLLLDEPTRGIDVASKAQVYKLIDDLVSRPEKGRAAKAVLMVSSYLPELLGICDRIAVMCRGRLGEARPVAETNEHKLMLEATGQV